MPSPLFSSTPFLPTPFLSVVVPAFNEESRIVGTLEQVLDYLGQQSYTWEVVLADDGSTDSTPHLVAEVSERRGEGRLHYLRLAHGGKGWAVRQGMLQAGGEFCFMCDADLSMSIDQLERFLPPVASEYDVAAGSRTIQGARRIGEPARRKVTAIVFSLLVGALAPCGVADTQCGFKCFRGEAAHRLFSLQKLDGFAFDVELLYLARKLGLRTIEVPIEWHHSPESKVRLVRDAVRMARDILRVRWHYLLGHYRP